MTHPRLIVSLTNHQDDSNRAAEAAGLEGTKGRRNEGTKERRNEGTKERTEARAHRAPRRSSVRAAAHRGAVALRAWRCWRRRMGRSPGATSGAHRTCFQLVTPRSDIFPRARTNTEQHRLAWVWCPRAQSAPAAGPADLARHPIPRRPPKRSACGGPTRSYAAASRPRRPRGSRRSALNWESQSGSRARRLRALTEPEALQVTLPTRRVSSTLSLEIRIRFDAPLSRRWRATPTSLILAAFGHYSGHDEFVLVDSQMQFAPLATLVRQAMLTSPLHRARRWCRLGGAAPPRTARGPARASSPLQLGFTLPPARAAIVACSLSSGLVENPRPPRATPSTSTMRQRPLGWSPPTNPSCRDLP